MSTCLFGHATLLQLFTKGLWSSMFLNYVKIKHCFSNVWLSTQSTDFHIDSKMCYILMYKESYYCIKPFATDGTKFTMHIKTLLFKGKKIWITPCMFHSPFSNFKEATARPNHIFWYSYRLWYIIRHSAWISTELVNVECQSFIF